jgi:uncharacterized membrane protein
MPLDQSTAERVGVALAAVTALAGLAVWPDLPAEMAIHFSAAGEPDNYAPRPVAVAFTPVAMLVTMGIVRGALRFDPPDDERVPAVTTVATMLLLAAVQALVLAYNLGHEVPFDLFLVGVGVWTVAVVGYALRVEGLSLS